MNYYTRPDFIVAARSIVNIVSLTDARAHVRLFGDTSFDSQLTLFLEAAQQTVEDYVGEYFGATDVIQPFNRFNTILPLAHTRINSITSVTYRADDGTTKTVASSIYTFDDSGLQKSVNRLNGENWPTDINDEDYRYPIAVNYEAEWPTPPAAIHQAILLLVGDMFDNRDQMDYQVRRSTRVMASVESLLAPYRRW